MEVPINEKSRVLLIKVVMHILDVSIFAPIVDEKGENYKTPRASLLELGNLNPPVLIKTTQEVYVPLKLETSFLEVFIMVKEVLDWVVFRVLLVISVNLKKDYDFVVVSVIIMIYFPNLNRINYWIFLTFK